MASSISFTNILENIGRNQASLENKSQPSYDDTAVNKTMSIKDYYAKSIFFLFLALVFLTPLIFTTNTKEMFEFPKMHFVYVIGTTIVFLFVLKNIFFEEEIKAPDKLISAFVAVYTISTLLSSNGHTSFWGYYTRFNGGLFSILVFFGLYVVLTTEFSFDDVIKLVKASAFTLIPIGLYSIGQHYEVTANLWEASPEVRAFSTFGQPNWFAAYAAMLLPVCVHFLINAADRKERLLWLAVFIVGFSGMWFAYSLSGLLGLFLGIIFSVAFERKSLAGEKNRKNRNALVAGFVLCIAVALLNPGPIGGRLNDALTDTKESLGITPNVQKQTEPPAQQSAQTPNNSAAEEPAEDTGSYFLSDTGAIRRGLWEGTIRQILSKPKIFLIGTGPETYPYEFQKFRPKELNFTSEWDFVFNKPHNYYLELVSTAGIFAAALYLAITIISLKTGLPAFASALASLSVTNFFGWPTVSTALLFWLFLAGIRIQLERRSK